MHRPDKQIGWPTLAGLSFVVVAFMALSLCVTATGTARFAVGMGYDARMGYAVGAIFDLAKGMLPVALLALLARRAFGTAVLLGAAWMCLVAYSCLATHATVSTAISESSAPAPGRWRCAATIRRSWPRSSSSSPSSADRRRRGPPKLSGGLGQRARTSGIWNDSEQCAAIQASVHFARACAQVVLLRRELAAAQDYERLSARAGELRKGLAAAPIVATADPLPAAFSATLGRVLPIGGTEGVALLITMVVEIISCFGLAGLRALSTPREQRLPSGRSGEGSPTEAAQEAVDLKEGAQHTLPGAGPVTLPKPSLKAVPPGRTTAPGRRSREGGNPPSNVVPMHPPSSPREQAKGGSPGPQGGPARKASATGSHVAAFVEARLQNAPGASLAARDLRAAYEAWCAKQGHPPLTVPKFAAELKALGYGKWKSCGLVRYRGLQLVA